MADPVSIVKKDRDCDPTLFVQYRIHYEYFRALGAYTRIRLYRDRGYTYDE